MRKITNNTKFWAGQKLYNDKQLDKYRTITNKEGDRLWIIYSSWSKDTGPYDYSIRHLVNEDKWHTYDITEYFEAINNQ